MLSPQYQKLVPRTQSEVTVKQYLLFDYHPVLWAHVDRKMDEMNITAYDMKR